MSSIQNGTSSSATDDTQDLARNATPHPAWQRAVADAHSQVRADAQSGTTPVQTVARPGDTLTSIAAKYGTSVHAIVAANPSIRNLDRIEAGQHLTIPVANDLTPPTEHVVQPGETLGAIASHHHTSVATLAAANSIGDPDNIRAGQKMAIPGTVRLAQETAPPPAPLTAAAVPKPSAPLPPSPQEHAQNIIGKAQAESDPNAAIKTLSNAYAAARPDTRAAILADPGAGALFQHAADAATQPLTAKSNAGAFPQAKAADAIGRLDHATQGLDPAIAGAVAERAAHAFQAYAKQPDNSGQSLFGMRGMTSLMQLGGRIHGTDGGDAALQDFASTNAWNPDAVRNSIAGGADPAYAITLGSRIKDSSGPLSVATTITDGIVERDQGKIAQGGTVAPTLDVAQRMQAVGLDPSGVRKVATDGAEAFKRKIGDDVTALAKHDAELAWLIKNDGPGLSGAQLRTAIADYRNTKGAAWQADETTLKNRIGDDGTKLIAQLTDLGHATNTAGKAQPAMTKTLSDIVNDPSAGLAISTALQTHPDLATPANAAPLVNIFSLSKIGDVGRKLLNEYAAGYVRNNVLKSFKNLNLTNPASVAEAKTNIAGIATAPMAKALGVTQSDLKKAIAEVDNTFGRVAAAPDQAETALADLNKTFNDKASLAKAFNKTTFAGQALRTVALGFAIAGVANSSAKALDNPSDLQNGIKALTDATGLAQKSTELLVARGLIDKASPLGQFGGEWKAFGRASAGDLLTGLGVALDVASAVRAFGGIGTEKDAVSGAFYGTSAVGGGLALASTLEAVGVWGGPVGIGIAAVGIAGNLIYGGHKDAHRYEDASAKFLQAGGFDASASQALSARGGLLSGATGAAQIPFLERYGQMRGLTPTQLQHWVDSLTPAQARDLSSRLLQTAGDSNADPAKFSNGPPQTVYVPGGHFPVAVTLTNTLGVFEQNLARDHIPRP